MPGRLASAAIVTIGLLANGGGVAASDSDWFANRLLAEVIMVPQPTPGKAGSKAGSKAAGASEQRDRAKSYQQDEAPASTTVIVLPEEEADGALSPRGSPPPEKARDNRSRASDYQHGTDSPLLNRLVKPEAGSGVEPGSTQDRARDNRSRAGAYSRGETPSGLTGRVGPDGIPLVVCKDKDNVAGQIGDGLQSGSVIVILRDGKQVKVRCQ